jgi:hypothetical protein
VKGNPVVRGDVFAQGEFLVGAPVDIVEYGARQPLLGYAPKVCDIDNPRGTDRAHAMFSWCHTVQQNHGNCTPKPQLLSGFFLKKNPSSMPPKTDTPTVVLL